MSTLNTRDSDNERDGDARARHVRVKNRRRRYLELHPEYFDDASREIADPLLYDRLVRQFMSSEERERQGRERGFAGALAASLTRSEAKLEALEHPDPEAPISYVRNSDGVVHGVEQDESARPATREDGWQQWVELVTDKFIHGLDPDFDYAAVDDIDDYDDQGEEDRNRLEAYLNEEDELQEGTPQAETGIQDF